MPMQWDAAADQKLFAAVVRVFDVKLANGVGEKLAKFMGPECNAKSIANHFTVIRKRANEMREDGTEGGVATPAKKTKGKAKRGGGKGKNAASEGEDDEDESPPAKKQKRGRVEDGIEVGEDIGQGLRKKSKIKAEVDEDEDDEV